jgi:hypothetical protein
LSPRLRRCLCTGRGGLGARLMRFALTRLASGGIGCGLRCRGRLRGRIGAIARGCRLSGGIASSAQIPAFGLFDRVGAVVPVATRRRLSGRCRQTILFRPGRMSAHAASGKNKQCTQNGKRSCFRHSPSHPVRLLPQAITDPSANAPELPTVPTRFKKYCSENVLSGRRLHNFLLTVPCPRAAAGRPKAHSPQKRSSPAKKVLAGGAIVALDAEAGSRPLNQASLRPQIRGKVPSGGSNCRRFPPRAAVTGITRPQKQGAPPGYGRPESRAWPGCAGRPYTCRSTIRRLISAIALAGFKCFGQALAQFIMVWQR